MTAATREIRVAVFEDNKLIRDAYEAILSGDSGFICVGVFPDCTHLQQKINRSKPDVVLMDIEMLGTNGIEATRQIAAEFPEIRILIQTVFEDDDKIFAAICAGACGYILKSNGLTRLLEAVAEAYHGGSPMSASVASKMLKLFQQFGQQLSQSGNEEPIELSSREKEILQQMTQGKSLRTIAAANFISYETVRTHVKKIYKKLYVASASEAVAKAIRQKLV